MKTTARAIKYTCEHCSHDSMVTVDNLFCRNPACEAPVRPDETLLIGLFGRSVQVLTRPISAIWRFAVKADVLPVDEMAAHVVDISRWQYLWDDQAKEWITPNFQKMLFEVDTLFVIHKASQGNFSDPCYELGKSIILGLGAKLGTFHYCDPKYGAVESAEKYAAQINAIPPEDRWDSSAMPFPFNKLAQHWVDVERIWNGVRDLTPTEMTAWVKTFVETLASLTDQRFGIYTRTEWWNRNILRNSWAHKCPLWVARYNSIIQEPGEPIDWSAYGEKPVLWQYSADGNGQGRKYGAQSKSIDLNRSPLLTDEEVLDIVYDGTIIPPPGPPPVVTCDQYVTLFDRQAFRTEPSDRSGNTTVIKRLPAGSILQLAPCSETDEQCTHLVYSTTSRRNEIWFHCIDSDGDAGWIAAYHAPSRSTLYLIKAQ